MVGAFAPLAESRHEKNVFVFSRLAPEHLERLQRQFNVRVLEPKQGDIDASTPPPCPIPTA